MYPVLECSESDFLIKFGSLFCTNATWEVLIIKIYVDMIKNPHTKAMALLMNCSKQYHKANVFELPHAIQRQTEISNHIIKTSCSYIC